MESSEFGVAQVEQAESLVHYVEPPVISRRQSVIDNKVVADFAKVLGDDRAIEKWLTTGESLPRKTLAYSRVQAYREVLAKQLGIESKDIAGRVWEDQGRYLFALSRMAK